MIYIKDIIDVCDGKLISGKLDIKCQSFSKDTRTLEKGDIYVGIRGETFNGNAFYKDAIKKGASACILDDKSVLDGDYGKATIILVDNSVKAIQALAKYKRGLYNIPVIGVTGSVGKTSVKDIVSAVVSSKYKTLCTNNTKS